MAENLRIGSGPTTSFSASLGRSLLTAFRRGSHRPEWLRGLGLGRKPPLEKKPVMHKPSTSSALAGSPHHYGERRAAGRPGCRATG